MNKRAVSAFHRRLHAWYARHGRRDLPWRTIADPYAIYISEIMLQQTQVATVLERFYFPFLKRFPSLRTLAQAGQDEVLHAWQGLGYYNRAINLHKAAQQCKDGLPASVDELRMLPGIGRNTAHAVAAFAFRQPVAVMEANVRRVLARIFAMEHPGEAELWEKAALLLDTAEPFDYNQAMMDIGALVCRKRAPDCAACPANIICQGKGAPESYPAAKSKKAPPVRRKRIVLLRNGKGEYHAIPRATRFLNGLYHFMEMDAPRYCEEGVFLGSIRQQYSHFTLEAEVYLAQGERASNHWYSFAQLQQLPMSMAEKKILALLEAQ